MIIGMLSAFVPLLAIGLVAAAIVALVKGRLTLPTVAHAYTAVVFGVCVVLAGVGGAYLLTAGFSELIARDFSYSAQPDGYGGPYQNVDTQFKNDIALGVTLVAIGVTLGVIHALGKAVTGRRNPTYAVAVERGFDAIMLFVTMVTGLASGIMLLNDLLRRYVITDTARPDYQLPHPGGPLAFTVMFLPLWVYFGVRVWRFLAGKRPPVGTAVGEPIAAPTT